MNDLHHPALPPPHVSVAVIGGGQAGLSVSHGLKRRGIDHVVIEKNRLGHAWRESRWDSFCLVTPNWQCTLPGFPYGGEDPKGFMKKDEIVRYVEGFAASFDPPIREGVAATRLRRDPGGRYHLWTTGGRYTADHVVVAVGGYHVPVIPRFAERLPADIAQIHSADYRNPESMPDGAVLVVGTGQSGCQIAEDLHLAGRRVHLCVGGAPRSPRQYRGRDVVEWLTGMGYYDIPIHEHPQKDRVRSKANHYMTGRDGGREIDLRRFATEGMHLHGRLTGLDGTRMVLADDLRKNLDQADATAESIRRTIDDHIQKNRIDAPAEAPYRPAWQPPAPLAEMDLRAAGITSVIWCIGYRTDFSWVEIPVFDGKGYPGHDRGVTPVDGLYFIGLPWLYTWGSGRFSGVALDAAHLVEKIESRLGAGAQGAGVNALALGS